MRYITTIGEKEYLIEIIDQHHVSVDGEVFNVDFTEIKGQLLYSLLINGHSLEALISADNGEWQVLLQGTMYQAQVEDESQKRLKATLGEGTTPSQEFHLKAPMPGLVIAVPVSEDQAVEKGEVLVILESMKMQNELKSPRAGRVCRVRVKEGDNVEQRQTMLCVM
ncbi:MAG: biotin/lipoyl-containing protein [Chloroflexota bacterium]